MTSPPQSHRPDHCALDQDQDTDRECVSLLPRVCELLAASGSCLPDDTSLEKLLDWFSQLSQAGTSLHENFPCLLEFIPTVTHNTVSDPAVICFMIKLTGVMAATVEGFQTLQGRLTLDEVFRVQRWQEATLWEDPSVRSGWIHGLRNMMQHSRALSFFIQSELMGHLLLLQTDSSLFVASSANQLLAHILLFYQPESLLTDSKDHSYKETHLKQNGREPSPLLSSTPYNAVVMSTCDYLKQSLLLKEQKQLYHSARLLRLITQILSQAGALLWSKVSEAVSGPLEDLVTAENSQLTLPLMEVILAAYSTSSPDDQSASGLLCAMLEARDPTERIRAAAALLHKGLCDPVYTSKAVKILLLPLDVVTGHSVLCSDAAGEIKEELQKNKSFCTSLICMCVANLHQITLLPANFLPRPPTGIVSTLVSLLHMSISGAMAWPGCVEVIKYIFGNGKFQKCALDALTAVSQCSGAHDKVSEVFTVLLLYLDHPHSGPIVLHKCYQAVLKWTSVCIDLSWMSYQLRQDLLQVVQKRVCDLRWEVRDSTVEFLGQQAALAPPSSIPSQSLLLLDECSTLPLLREALQDQESYVRASAVSALAQTLQRGWSQGAVESTEQTDIVTKLLSILCEDTEGFSRRAVVQYFISWFSSSSSSPSLLISSIPSILSRGSSDLDWEVKVHTLELATLLMNSTLAGHLTQPSHPYAAIPQPTYNFSSQNSRTNVEDSLSKLVEQGVISTLLSGFYDCDRPVGLKACQLLISLREALKKSECTVKCSLPSWGWGQEIRTLMGNLNGSDLVNVQEVLRCLNLEQRLCVLSQSSDHVQNSPLSLLQDILTARDVHSHPGTAEGQEIIVDCY